MPLAPSFQGGLFRLASSATITTSTGEFALSIEIKLAHKRTRQTYGAERLQAYFADNGTYGGVHRIKRIRRELGLRCRQKQNFRIITDLRHKLPIAPSLDRQLAVSVPNTPGLQTLRMWSPTRDGGFSRAFRTCSMANWSAPLMNE